MAITNSDLKIFKSQRMTDNSDGGGRITGNEVLQGQSNAIFPDISEVDTAYGRVAMRLIYPAVHTTGTDEFFGSRFVIIDLPQEESVDCLCFKAEGDAETREQARARLERYLIKGPMWNGWLYDNHGEGLRSVTVAQLPDTNLPPIGKTLHLVESEGQPGEKSQYVQVTDVDVTEAVFEDGKGQYTRWVVRMDITQALKESFTGHPATADKMRSGPTDFDGIARVRDTTVAEAAQFKGVHPLEEDIEVADLQCKVDSIFSQLLPAARAETPMVSQVLNPEIIRSISAGSRTVDVAQQAHTLAQQVTAENRGFNWVKTLAPIPAPGTLTVAYLFNQKWYSLKDNGAGTLEGTQGAGTGNINYTTGACNVTLGARPDVGSQVIFIWGSPVHFNVRVGNGDIDTTPEITHSVEEPIKPGTLVLTWLQGGSTKTASANSAGVISGDATGWCNHATGEFLIKLLAMPDSNSSLGIEYNRDDGGGGHIFSGLVESGGMVVINAGTPIAPGTLSAEWVLTSATRWDETRSYVRLGV